MADLTPTDFAVSLIKTLGVPDTPANRKAIVGWQNAEGGHWHNQARYNPLNTTQPEPGAGNTGSQGNIKVYQSWQQGLKATADTLRNGRYGGILAALKQGNNPDAVANAISSSPWGTNGSLVRRTIASASPGGSTRSALLAASVPAGTRTVPGVDRSAQRSALLLNYLENDHAPDALLSLGAGLSQAQDVPGRTVALRAQAAPSGPTGSGGGVASFNGTQVASWMVPALRYAQQHGWDGKLTSGVRTRAEQAALYANRANNPNPVAPPGKSNHEVENGGAVDVANPAALARALRGFKGRTLVQGTAIGDPVHFSATGR